MKELDVTRMERKAMMTWNGDGIADTLMGFSVLAAGILMLFNVSHAMLAAWLPAMFFKWIKDRVSVPRMGLVSFRPSRPVKLVRLTVQVLIILMVVALLFLIILHERYPRLDAFLQVNLELIVGGFLGALVMTGGVLMGTRRFVGYGLLLLVLSVGCRLDLLRFPYVFAIAGSIAFVTGTVILVRFLRENPIPDEGACHVQNG